MWLMLCRSQFDKDQQSNLPLQYRLFPDEQAGFCHRVFFFNLHVPVDRLKPMSQIAAQEPQIAEIACRTEEVMDMPLSKAKHILKRMFDVVFSLVVILTLFPLLFPLLYVLIKLDSKGGAFFVQKRNGLNNKVFHCFKFRTMVANEEADARAAGEADWRITRIGKVLRVSGLDELPQFVNVLLGQMSIVGPRPHMISDNLKFAQLSERYHQRSLVKPGITGLAQIKGYKGDTSDARSIRKRTALDLIYVENYSLLLDLKIIWSTVGLMFKELFKLAGK
jgi:lipopolysaccharide/colanic/teichoic acid biosynthesis glycosyltransferase